MRKIPCLTGRLITMALLRAMAVVILLVGSFAVVWATPEQDKQMNQRITLSMKDASVAEIIQQIRRTTNYRFLFQVDDVKNVNKADFTVSDASIREVMDKLVAGTGLTYTFRGDEVVVIAQQVKTALQPGQKFTINGKVFEKSDPKNPIPFASVYLPDLGIGTATKADGTFVLKNLDAGTYKLEVSSLGFETIKMTVVLEKQTAVDLKFEMEESNFRLKEVLVTAQNSKAGAATSSTISRIAMDHMQATSLNDVMALMPGQLSENQTLKEASALNIRFLTLPDGDKIPAATAMNSLGSAVYKDGAPVSNNANLQALSPAFTNGTSAVGGSASPAKGIDLRNVSVDNVESIEVIRGIPSAEYGDLTSGAVIINTKMGVEPLKVNFRTNPNVYLFSASKGLNLGKERGTLHVSGDYAYSVNNPVQSYVFYQRATARVLYSNLFLNKRLRSNTSVDFVYGDNRRKKNPDEEVRKLKQNGTTEGITINTNGILNTDLGWLKNIRYTLSGSYTLKNSKYQEMQSSANAPFSMTTTNGTTLSSKPGVDVYDENGNKITNFSGEDASKYAVYLPDSYLVNYSIQGKEINVFAKLTANFIKKAGNINNRITLGVDFRSDGNRGNGLVFDPTSPPYRNLSAVNSTFRARAYKDVPFINQLGAFVQENFNWQIGGKRDLDIAVGLRYDKTFNFDDILTPRINAALEIVPDVFSLKGGFGIASKAPSLMYLHPETAYFEFVHFNSMAIESVPEAQRLLLSTTYAVNTENPNLKMAKNQKAEAGFNLNLGKLHVDVTAFQEKMKNGYSLSNAFMPMMYKIYEQYGDLPADGVSFPTLKLANEYPVLMGYNTPKNNVVINTKGVEMELNVSRIDAIRTAFSVSGAYMRTETYSNDYTYYAPTPTDPAKRTHVGLYEKGMEKFYKERLLTTFRLTHNIPSIGLVATLAAQVTWMDNNWYKMGNDSIPVKYISKYDGKTYDFDIDKVGQDGYMTAEEFSNIKRTVDKTNYIKENMPPLLCMNVNVTKEFGDYLRVSFFANNMFRSHPVYKLKRSKSSYRKRNEDIFFGLELSLLLK